MHTIYVIAQQPNRKAQKFLLLLQARMLRICNSNINSTSIQIIEKVLYLNYRQIKIPGRKGFRLISGYSTFGFLGSLRDATLPFTNL